VETSWTILLAGEMMSMVAQMSQTGLWPSSSPNEAAMLSGIMFASKTPLQVVITARRLSLQRP